MTSPGRAGAPVADQGALAPGATVALVFEGTPAEMLYGDYSGWVELDQTGTYVCDLTDADVAAANVMWDDPHDPAYARTGVVSGRPVRADPPTHLRV